MAEARETPALQPVARPLSLIPVGLKEAALDSPTFRATAVHFSDQVEVVERWLDGYIKSTAKFVHEASALEELVNSHINRLAPPPIISEAVLDHDYTLLALKRYGEGTRDFWSHTLAGLKRLEPSSIEPIRSFLHGELRNFKDSRRYLEQSQRHFDSLLARNAAQSRTKEPSALREDAFQLYEARKQYIKASMDFCILAPQLRASLDKLLVKVCSDQWREWKKARDGFASSAVRSSNEMDRVKSWSYEMEAGERTFRRELLSARKMLEEKAGTAARPSRELDDYSVSTVPYLTSKGHSTVTLPSPIRTGPDRAEKQGWLFQKTLTGKPTRPLWVRRWFFVKNGIFGWLVQGARSGGVEESERIGVLLCSAKPAFQEERRFCLEVKTKDNTVLLQADSQSELSDWLDSFETAKRKALEDSSGPDSPTTGVHSKDAAFAINPPSAPEFAAKTSDTYGNDEPTSGSFDRSATLPVPDREGGGLINRGSFDVTSRKSAGGEREGEGAREHAARIIQKLDLHRKSNSGLPSDVPQSAGLPPAGGGGIASLISASHNILPVHTAPAVASPSGPTGGHHPTKSEVTIGGIGSSASGQAAWETPSSTLAPSTLCNPPAPTNLSKTAVVVSGERGMGLGRSDVTGGMPSGLMANLWGSSNWGYINRLERGEVKQIRDIRALNPPSPGVGPEPRQLQAASEGSQGPQAPGLATRDSDSTGKDSTGTGPAVTPSPSPSRHRATISLDVDAGRQQRKASAPDSFPWNYPLPLKTQEAQFRMLFPNARREDKLLLVFRAAWNPNDQQDFPGRVYVTASSVYFYSHHLGLVLTSVLSLGSIVEVTAAPGKDCDFLFLHLKPGSLETGNRIGIKIFLEPLRLLQRRLNLLVRNFSTGEFPTLEVVLNELLKMEKERPAESPSHESWENVSINTPADDGTSTGRATRGEKDVRTSLRVHGGLFDDPRLEQEAAREGTKFRLPAQPVLYEPKGYARLAVDRTFEISPKALFHVMFGDKSAVFQLLYHERRAQRIRQGPWTQVEGGRLGRAFEYQIDYVGMLGRTRQANVADKQTIDLLDDHLCYVVTDRKTPWHLPHHKDFTLISQIVITHVAKSKCKLAVYTQVEWKNAPTFSKGMVEKQALDDLSLDALDLADVISDQVRRLGPQSRTKKAITIFGHIGQQTQASLVTGGDSSALKSVAARRLPIRQRSLGQMLFETGVSVAGSGVSSLMIWGFAFLRSIWKISSANGIILSFLALSIAANMFYSSRATHEWWTERSAGRYMANLGVGGREMIMRKGIHLEDVHEMISNHTVEPTSQCYQTFDRLLRSPSTPFSRKTSSRLARTRNHLAVYRHDLVVALRLVNRIERETMQAEWEHWVWDEVGRCGGLESIIKGQTVEQEALGISALRGGRDLAEVRTWSEAYCESCRGEMNLLGDGHGERSI